jgi:cytidine deaminase
VKEHHLQISFQTTNLASVNSVDQYLLTKAEEMAAKAYAPYSEFKVGASLHLSTEQFVDGNNQENAAYPSGLCAERVAIFSARSQYPQADIQAIAIYVPTEGENIMPSPCGACRQVLSEVQSLQSFPIRILLMNKEHKVWIFSGADTLLPFSFSARHLNS